MQDEPEQDKHDLQAAITQSQHVAASQTFSEDGLDGSSTGVGDGLSLPGFVANFLRGVSDRTQLNIANVTVDLEMDVCLPSHESHNSGYSNKEDNVTTRLNIASVEIEGITTHPEGAIPEPAPLSSVVLQDKQTSRTRQVRLQGISGLLTSELSAFARLRYPLSPPSQCTQQSSPRSEHKDLNSARCSMNPSLTQESIHVATSEESNKSSASRRRVSASLDGSHSTIECPSDLVFDETETSVFNELGKSGKETINVCQEGPESSAIFPGSLPTVQGFSSLGQAQESIFTSSLQSQHSGLDETATRPHKQAQENQRTAEDLSESKVFSHEEAESMYMSAISYASLQPVTRRENHQTERPPPGTWDSSSSDEGITESQPLAMSTSRRVDKSIQGHRCTAMQDESHESQSGHSTPKAFSTPSPGHTSPLSSHSLSPTPQNPYRNSMQQTEDTDDVSSSDTNGKDDHDFLIKRILFLDEIILKLVHGKDGIDSKDVRIGHIDIVGDLELTKLIIAMLQRFIEISKSGVDAEVSIRNDVSRSSSTKISLVDFNWKYLDTVPGVLSSKLKVSTSQSTALADGGETLLKASLNNIRLEQTVAKDQLETRIGIGKVNFGYTMENILSFDSGLKLRESIRDNLAPANGDLQIIVTQTMALRKIDVTSLPLHIHLDLCRLDETFSWFGGFSHFLGLGSSIMSTVTATDAKPPHSPNKSSSKGVHFADRSDRDTPQRSGVVNKVTVRLGGLLLDLQGSDSLFRLESTALKVASRAEVVGVQIDRLNLDGPRSSSLGETSAIRLALSNLRVEYFATPKEVDLAKLLGLLTPSKDGYGDDDDILIDTLLRQRRQGGVIRWTSDTAQVYVADIGEVSRLKVVIKDLEKLSRVTKYLPEDDRPGILTLGLLRNLQIGAHINNMIGDVDLVINDLELANVTFPSLMALGIDQLRCSHRQGEKLMCDALPGAQQAHAPVVMMRFIGNELEPTIKVKLQNLRFEYHVTTLMALMGIPSNATSEDFMIGMADSVATIIDRKASKETLPTLPSQVSWKSDSSAGLTSKVPLTIDVTIRDLVVGLNPFRSQAKGLVVLSESNLLGTLPKNGQSRVILKVDKAALMAIDDRNRIDESQDAVGSSSLKQIQSLSSMGFVPLSTISAASAELNVLKADNSSGRTLDIEIKDDLLVLESCADSMQTLQSICIGLVPPMPPNQIPKYRTEVINVEHMLASLTGEAFTSGGAEKQDDLDFSTELGESDMVEDEVPQNLEYVSSFYNPDPEALQDSIAENMLEDDLEAITRPHEQKHIGDKPLLESFQEQCEVAPDNESLHFQDDYFAPQSNIQGTAHRWNTREGTYELAEGKKISQSPLKVRVRDVHVIWNLFDGYDWQHTRDTLGQAVATVEAKANERRAKKRRSLQLEDDEESVIGDFLFNSIYIGVNANRDPRELAHQINREIDDLASETETYKTSSTAKSPTRQGRSPRATPHKLRLNRSRYHKMTFELKGICADYVLFPHDAQETQSSLDIRVHDLEVFDHVPTSTWKKFATYMHDAGERESGTDMVHLEILTVKPVPDLAASEIIMKATVLPLRLHVDQDALDFMTRFFDFQDDSAVSSTPRDVAFIQRVEVNAIRVKLDFKPKRVDYVGLRSGRTTEFMNFFILDNADMVLRRVILYGVSGFDRLGKTLNDIWMPDVRRNQLPGVLAGLAPVRSLVNVGGGIKDLVVVPVREYRKDGRIVRSIQKGALAFAKTTTTELVKLGAKLAIGTQTVLQGAEDLLGQQQYQDVSAGWENASLDDDEKKKISLYADQPVGVVQGLRAAYTSLERDLITAKDAIVAMPGEVMESGTASGAAKAVVRGAPTVILRPALGVSKAVGQTLMGTANTLDPQHRRRVDEVSLRLHSFMWICNAD